MYMGITEFGCMLSLDQGLTLLPLLMAEEPIMQFYEQQRAVRVKLSNPAGLLMTRRAREILEVCGQEAP